MLKRVPVILAGLAAMALIAAPSASATNMTPLVTCVDKTADGYLAHFGYRNDETFTVTRTVARSEGKNSWLNFLYNGKANDWTNVDDKTLDRGQPTVFAPGVHDDVFTVPFTSGVLTWALVGRWATASADSPACPPKPTPNPEPQPQPQPQPTPPADTTTPAAGTSTTTTGTSTTKKTCTSRRTLTIRLRERKGQRIRSAKVTFNGKVIAVSRRTTDGRVIAKIDFRKLPSGRFSVKITAKLTSGKTKTYTRKYYTCKPKLGPANNLGSKTSI